MYLSRKESQCVAAIAIFAYAAGLAWPCGLVELDGDARASHALVPYSVATPSHGPAGARRLSGEAHETHSDHDTASDREDDTAALLVAKCTCGCDERPGAAGISTSPGYALLPHVPFYTAPLVQGRTLENTPASVPAPTFAIDHVPQAFLA